MGEVGGEGGEVCWSADCVGTPGKHFRGEETFDAAKVVAKIVQE